MFIQEAAQVHMQRLADEAEMALRDDDSPSMGSAASLEMYQSINGLMIPADRGRNAADRISMKSDCGINMHRHYSIVMNGQHKVCL